MMSRDSICGRVRFRWICPPCTIMAFALLSVLPIGGAGGKSLARPQGNTTGFANFEPSFSGKWVELLKEAASFEF